ncbi:MAG: DUF6464 family protein [Pseudanabaenaceae cyanobacterium SKYGB_i_bin29]|nr:DUF6464 family protein [Pseudanabaenaceae cyanobacterium SKYG29]MDW8420888.1 DUF6464 family protein [Pseudanabaenaceae cyanobacterium SKYGB_i_bin29]
MDWMDSLNNGLPVELRSHDRLIARLILDHQPQPGQCIEVEGNLYRILERRHLYRLQKGKYRLYKATLAVQPLERGELYEWEGRWVLGNPNCRYSARSELVRCAVYPAGPCSNCPHFEGL